VACSGTVKITAASDGGTEKTMKRLQLVEYDAGHQHIYVAGDQFVDVFEQQDADHYALLGRVPGAFRAKTALYVPELNRYFLAVPHHENKDAEVWVYNVVP